MSGSIKHVSEVPTDEFNELVNKVDALYNKLHPENEYLNVKQVAERLNLTPGSVRRLKNVIGHSKPGGDIIFLKSDVEAYIMRHYLPPTNNKSQVAAKRVAR